MTSRESYFTTVFPLLTEIWTRWFLILIKPSIWLWPGSVEATLMLLQSNPQFWRNYQRKEKLFLHNQPSPGQHAFHVVGQEELCSLPFLCPPQIVQLHPPSITQASGHSWISWITAGKCSIAISPVLLTWCYYLRCWLLLELLSVQTEGTVEGDKMAWQTSAEIWEVVLTMEKMSVFENC